LAQHRVEVVELADRAAHLDVVVADGGQAGRVVAAVLELAQSGDENARRLPGSDVSDDSTHRSTVLGCGGRGNAPPSPRRTRGASGARRAGPEATPSAPRAR